MRFDEYINEIDITEDTVITIGNFDGVHKGHKKLLDLTLKLSREHALKSVVFTYSNHPLEFVMNKSISKLTLNEERDRLFYEMGIDYILSVPFDETIMNLSTRAFIEHILIENLNAKFLVLGEDARFGKGREGSATGIKAIAENLGLKVEIVPLYFEDGLRISSTSVRELIKQGSLETANNYLGRIYSISGKVVHGKKNGRKIGFPTANVDYDSKVVLPGIGVYYTIVEHNNRHYLGATSVGYNPTVTELAKTVYLEVNLFNFSQDIYGEEITVYFCKKIRNEMKFDSLEELKNQIRKDKEMITKLFLSENFADKQRKLFTTDKVCDIIM